MSSENEYAAIVLAAGAASRWGDGPKALAEWGGETLIDRACETAQAAGGGVVWRVLGAHRGAIEARPAPAGVKTVWNERWAEGLGGSIAAGTRALAADPEAAECAAVLILLCDQPLVTAGTLRRLAGESERNGRGLVYSDYGDGRRGPPALVARIFWEELAGLTGEEGARRLARAHPEAVAWVAAPEAAVDIDTREDLRRLRGS